MNWTTLDPNVVMWALVGAINLATLYYTRRTEKNTNSLKDELVASTKSSSHAAGLEEGRLAGERKAAVLAQGELAQSKKEE